MGSKGIGIIVLLGFGMALGGYLVFGFAHLPFSEEELWVNSTQSPVECALLLYSWYESDFEGEQIGYQALERIVRGFARIGEVEFALRTAKLGSRQEQSRLLSSIIFERIKMDDLDETARLIENIFSERREQERLLAQVVGAYCEQGAVNKALSLASELKFDYWRSQAYSYIGEYFVQVQLMDDAFDLLPLVETPPLADAYLQLLVEGFAHSRLYDQALPLVDLATDPNKKILLFRNVVRIAMENQDFLEGNRVLELQPDQHASDQILDEIIRGYLTHHAPKMAVPFIERIDEPVRKGRALARIAVAFAAEHDFEQALFYLEMIPTQEKKYALAEISYYMALAGWEEEALRLGDSFPELEVPRIVFKGSFERYLGQGNLEQAYEMVMTLEPSHAKAVYCVRLAQRYANVGNDTQLLKLMAETKGMLHYYDLQAILVDLYLRTDKLTQALQVTTTLEDSYLQMNLLLKISSFLFANGMEEQAEQLLPDLMQILSGEEASHKRNLLAQNLAEYYLQIDRPLIALQVTKKIEEPGKLIYILAAMGQLPGVTEGERSQAELILFEIRARQ